MAEWSRETPWRQGHVLTDDTVDKFGLRDAQALEKSARLSKILKPAGKHICAIFFDVDDGEEVQRNESEDTYGLAVILLYPSQPNSQESETVALKVKEQIETAFKELFFNENNSGREIELLDCMVMSDEALTYLQSTLLSNGGWST